jgi:putative intracellular protease/amidase
MNSKTRCAYYYVLDTLSDWEAGHVIAELNSGQYFREKGAKIPVKTVSSSKMRILTKGGVQIVPDGVVAEITPETTAVLILPGANTWNNPQHQPVLSKAAELLATGGTVAAICGATAALAEAGLLDHRPHTSNGLEYLKMVAPHYRGAAHFREAKAVADGSLITASAAGSVEFARLILERLRVCSPEALAAWENYFQTGEAKYFSELMQSLPS